MNIEKIKIRNFKRIGDAEIDIGKVNYLVGGNNSGKSSTIQAIHMAVSCAKLSVERGEQVLPESELRYSPTSEFTQLGNNSPYENKKTGSRGIIEFIGKTVDDIHASFKIEIYKGRNYGNVGVDRTGLYPNFGNEICDPKSMFSIYVPGISGIPHREEYKNYASVFLKAAGGEANLVFRNIVRILHESSRLNEVEEIISVILGKCNLQVNHNHEKDLYVNVQFSMDGSKSVPIDLTGTGILQLVQIVSYVSLFRPKFLLVDEPDNHLHPSRQAQLARVFEQLTDKYGCTVIVTTHSRHLVAAASDDDKIIWMRDGKVESDSDKDLATILMDLGALDQLDSKGAEIIICTEDKGKEVIENSVKYLSIDDKVKVISYNGISNASSAVAIQAMADLLPKSPKVIIHRDRDFLTEEELEKWSSEYKKRGMEIFCPKLCDVETYLCEISHLSKVYEISSEEMKPYLTEVLNDNMPSFRAKFVKKRRDAISKYWKDGGGPLTDSLWPNDTWPADEFIYGKELLAKLNEKLSKIEGGRRVLEREPCDLFTEELRPHIT